ncbi:hypothetical protein L596_017645 [Steinernema carpocapsae]|uniref:Uncharacterized protein n=1 Tax=Steinernema carpocapsae TaxID=34508 RepID=A0A4U5N2J4_STECR|nr:hypothetical protein L596_017645 [Steinernema carpocapsae]
MCCGGGEELAARRRRRTTTAALFALGSPMSTGAYVLAMAVAPQLSPSSLGSLCLLVSVNMEEGEDSTAFWKTNIGRGIFEFENLVKN